MNLINKLEPLKKQLVKKEVYKYQRTALAVIFTEENLNSLANEIFIKMIKKQENNDLDEKGIYNFFKQSFKFKCIDEIKKYNCQRRKKFLENTNIDDCSFFIEDNKELNNPLNLQNSIDTLQIAFKELNEKQKKKPLSNILKLVLEGFNSSDIQDKLNISSSSLDRYKKEIISILAPLDLQESLIFNPPCQVNDIYHTEEEKKEEVTTYKMVKFLKEGNKTIASLYINNNGKNIKIKTWNFNHNDLDQIYKIMNNFDLTPHLTKIERSIKDVSK